MTYMELERLVAGKSIKELAVESRVQMIGRVERGLARFTPRELERVRQALGISEERAARLCQQVDGARLLAFLEAGENGAHPTKQQYFVFGSPDGDDD